MGGRTAAMMVNVRTRLVAVALASVSVLVTVQGCRSENSVVDGSCAEGYSECGRRCVDTSSDPEHCGGCSVRCTPGEACIGGVCGGAIDGSLDGSVDGSLDGGLLEGGGDVDGSLGDGGDACPPPPYVTAAACGACGIVCTAPNSRCVDQGGTFVCGPPCAAPLVECNGACVDLENDPVNCGACGKFCPSNICVAGVCQGSTPGDIVVIGHDYSTGAAASSQAKVLTNAVFIPRSNPLRILSYEQFADAAAVANVKGILQSAASGRTLAVSVATNPAALQSATLSQSYDVVIIHDQQGGAPTTLATMGAGWAPALETFAKAGGVIVTLDGAGGQGGMPSLLTSANLLALASHQSIPAGSLIGIVAPSDSVGSLVIGPYGAYNRTVTLQPNEPNGGNVTYVARHIVAGNPADPVVVHKVVP
ncbi:MAG: hypothetical protein BGO98_22250 [Myxococcales bacterium 68-20]|nr:MAG: hypothetical protein BGO98_22250 [Myxococcales bacterium 68-20]